MNKANEQKEHLGVDISVENKKWIAMQRAQTGRSMGDIVDDLITEARRKDKGRKP